MPLIRSDRIQPLAAAAPPLFTKRSAVDAKAIRPRNVSGPAHHDVAVDALHLSRPLFALVWAVYVVIVTLNATLALAFAAIYYGASVIRGGYMIESMGLLPLEYIPVVVACYAIVALFFGKLSFQAIVGSIRARRLVFKLTVRRDKRHEISLSPLGRLNQFVSTHVPFEVMFLVREMVEVVTQTYQVYKCSTLISVTWINDLYAATLVANCWISPVIHLRVKRDRALQRFLYICSDVVLDFASTFIVPVWIIFSIVISGFEDNAAKASDSMDTAFDTPMEDVAFSNQVKAVQQVFVVTWLDVLAKLLPFISMASCLVTVQRLVKLRPQTSSQITQQPAKHSIVHSYQTARQPQTLQLPAVPFEPSSSHRRSSRWCWRQYFGWLFSTHTVHAIFALWGVGILGIQLQTHAIASRVAIQNYEGCKASSQPWFVGKLSCTVLEINCYRRGFNGYAHEVASALDKVDPGGVSTLIISHCPQLHMPQQILTLVGLTDLEIFNTTIVEWGENAALVNSRLPALQFLNIARVNMSELPAGLQSVQFPNRLRDIAISLSNITTLPHDLHTKWRRMVSLVLERTLMEMIPATVAQINPSRLSLFNNRIRSIPPDFFTPNANFWILSIARNPVTAWPETIGQLGRLYLVLMDYTEITKLPQWLVDEGKKRAENKQTGIIVSAGGSLFCRQRANHVNETTTELFIGLTVVCREKVDEEVQGYMIEFFQKLRQP
jgi:hypothetical protein